MKKILFLMGLLFPVSSFAVSDPSIGAISGYFVVTTNYYSSINGFSKIVSAKSCTDMAYRLNARVAIDSPNTQSIYGSLKSATPLDTTKTQFNCTYNMISASTGAASYPSSRTISIEAASRYPSINVTYAQPDWPNASAECPTNSGFKSLLSNIPSDRRTCDKLFSNGKYIKTCGYQANKLTNNVADTDGYYHYTAYKVTSFKNFEDCGNQGEEKELLTPSTKSTLDSLLDTASQAFADETNTEASRTAVFDVIESINSDYPLYEQEGLQAIQRLKDVLATLEKNPDPDPDPDPDTPADNGEVIQAIKNAASSIVSSITTSVSNVTTAINNGVNSLKSSLLDIKTSTDAVKTSVDAVKTSTDAVKTSVDEVKTSTDSVKTSVDEVKTSTDAVKTSVDEVKTSTDAVKTSVDAVNDSVLSQGDRIVSAIRDIPSSQGGSTNVSVNVDSSGVESRLDEIKGFLSDFSASLGELSGLSDSDLQPENVPVVKNASDLDVFKGGFKTDTFTIYDQCPADIPFSMSFMGTPFSFSFSFALLCEKLAILGKLILIFSYFIALNIVLRAK